ncbi:MAG: DUF3794 domain-containing protein [Clostridia bacterium]|nr:DUF3794 domain-containing protein [Clostridia bacterium]
MDNLLKKQTVIVSRTAADSVQECTYSADYMLPEYCPDVAVVLKCLATPRVQNRQWSGEQLTLDGTVGLRVLYLDEERRCLRVAELSQPFSCSMHTDGTDDGSPVAVELTPKFVNCRAVSPRRLEVRGAFLLHAVARQAARMEMPVVPEDAGLFVRCDEVQFTAPRCMAEKLLTVNESVDFPDNLPPAEMLLSGDCRAVIRECKLLTGKAIVKGEIYCHHLYTDDTVEGSTYTLDYTLPFSQILDMEGAQEGMPHDVWVSVVADSAHLSVGADGRNTVLEVGVKLLIQLCLYAPYRLPLMLDAYHSRYPVNLEMRELSLTTSLGCWRDSAPLSMNLSMPAEPLEELIDVWAQPYPPVCRCEEGKVILAGRMPVCMLVRDGDGLLSYVERIEDYSLEFACEGNTAQGDVQVTQTRYRVADGKLELQLTLAITLYPSRRLDCRSVWDAALQTDHPYDGGRASVKLYYGEAGESLWEIGRSCHASPQAIAAENDLNGDCLERAAVLVIPMIAE